MIPVYLYNVSLMRKGRWNDLTWVYSMFYLQYEY